VTTLHDLCSLIRSKNAGPFVLTFDLVFSSDAAYERVRRNNPLTPELVARMYRVREDEVRIFLCDGARAMKISMPRPVVQGDPGDGDCYGGQQYAPLLGVLIRGCHNV
jgi:hypothetical protein